MPCYSINMKKSKPLYMVLFLLLIPRSLISAGQFSVEYLEGTLECNTGGKWSEMELGDMIPDSSTIRLSQNGYVELAWNGNTLTLLRDGIYEINRLADQVTDSRQFRSILSKKISSLLKGEQMDSFAAGGVRGDDIEKPSPENTVMYFEGTDYLDEGLRLYEEGKIESALALFERGTLSEVGAVRRECRFRYGVCAQRLGRLRESRLILTAMESDPTDGFFEEYAVVVSVLYIESMEYEKAGDLLDECLRVYPEGKFREDVLYLRDLMKNR